MDADEVATVFVEMCTRLDQLIEAQRDTNELLIRLEATVRDHLDALTEDNVDLFGAGAQRRGLGHLIPYGDNNNVHVITGDMA